MERLILSERRMSLRILFRFLRDGVSFALMWASTISTSGLKRRAFLALFECGECVSAVLRRRLRHEEGVDV